MSKLDELMRRCREDGHQPTYQDLVDLKSGESKRSHDFEVRMEQTAMLRLYEVMTRHPEEPKLRGLILSMTDGPQGYGLYANTPGGEADLILGSTKPEHRVAPPEMEAKVDDALGIHKLPPLRVGKDIAMALEGMASALGITTQAYLRSVLIRHVDHSRHPTPQGPMWVKVTKEQFESFVSDREPLERDTLFSCDPPMKSYNDFSSGRKWPESVVAQIRWNTYMKGHSAYKGEPDEYMVRASLWNPPKTHDSDCSSNNEGVPELYGPCDCSINPRGAYVRAIALTRKLEEYGFECEGGPLPKCDHWTELVKCIELLAPN